MRSSLPPPPAERASAGEVPPAAPLPTLAQSTPKQDTVTVDDSPLEKFLERAAPILAVERGINAKSRVRLLAVAREVKLPDAEFEPAVRLLQRAPAKAESPTDKATEPFRRYLHAKLEQSTVKTITPALEGRAVSVALSKFQLDPELARHAIGQVAAERGVKRFSQEDCEEYVNNLVAERLGDDEWLDDESVNRLREAGAEWGLSIADVDAIIVARAAANRKRHDREQFSSKYLLTAAIVAGVVVFLVVAVLVIWGNMGSGESKTEQASTEQEPPTPRERPRSRPPQKWWNVELVLAQSRARGVVPDYRPVYEQLCASDPDERAKAYERLVTLVRDGPNAAESRRLLSQVAAGCYALEPADGPAAALRLALLAPALPDGKKLPSSPEAYDRNIWAVETTVAGIYHESAPAARADELAAALGAKLGASVERSVPRREVERRCLAALATALFRQLAGSAAESPRLAARLREKLVEWSQDHLKSEELEQLDVEVLAALLAADGSSWRDHEAQIVSCIGSKDPLVVLKMLEIFERTKNPELQNMLAENLLLRARARAKSNSPADVSAAVREALGIVVPVAPATGRDRWQTLKSLADEALARRPAPSSDPGTLLDESLLLAYLGTLGCALAQQEPGYAVFDQMVKDGPPSLAGKRMDGEEDEATTEPARSDAPLAPTASQQRDLTRFVDGLAKYKDHNATQRLTFARGLAGLADRIQEIEPDQAVVIAKYLLGEKPDEEQRRLADVVEPLCRWKTVRLALADLLADPTATVKIPLSRAGELFGKVVKGDPVSTNFEGWAESVRERIFRGVLAELAAQPGSPAEGTARGLDRSAEALLGLYRTRAKLLGIGAAQHRAATTPALMLELLVGQQASLLGTGSLRPADAEYLARLPHELAVVEYLGTNDVRRTALAQRVWLRLASISLGRKRPDQASQAKALIDELAARDLKATHLLLQLRDGEATTLRMWLLSAPKE